MRGSVSKGAAVPICIWCCGSGRRDWPPPTRAYEHRGSLERERRNDHARGASNRRVYELGVTSTINALV